jgi:digeranylgeranylglycerophospholipid reductase
VETVIGAGPCGCLAAKEIAKAGKRVEIWEEHNEIGKPVQCAGLVSGKGLEKLNVDFRGSVLNEVRGARLYSPSGIHFEVARKKAQAYVIDRTRLDKICAEEAQSEGAEIVLGKRWEPRNRVDVAADGSLSRVVSSLGLTRRYIHTYQVEAKLDRDPDFVELHFSNSFAPGFFAWVIPLGDGRCRVGTGTTMSANPKECLQRFMKASGKNELSALIPVYKPGQKTVYGSTLLVGDAAAQVKATTGGGITVGGFCARIAGKIVGEGIPREKYESLWRAEFGRVLDLHLQIRTFADRLSDDEMDDLFRMAIDNGIPETIENCGDMDDPRPLINSVLRRPLVMLKLARYVKYL